MNLNGNLSCIKASSLIGQISSAYLWMRSQQSYCLIKLNIWDMRDVDGCCIHCDSTNDWCILIFNTNEPSITQAFIIAIIITNRKNSDCCFFGSLIRAIIANKTSRRNFFDVYNFYGWVVLKSCMPLRASCSSQGKLYFL